MSNGPEQTVCPDSGDSAEVSYSGIHPCPDRTGTIPLEDKLPDLNASYTDLQPFASGGQACISVAQDKLLHRKVAVKSLRSEFLKDCAQRDAFIEEARLMASIDHPSIVPVHGIAGDSGGGLHILMQHVRGRNLKEVLQARIREYEREEVRLYEESRLLRMRLEIFLKVCDAVAAAHAKNIIHGDLKPENIMVGESYDVYVMDWGIASAEENRLKNAGKKRNVISGTPKYLSPEAVRGELTDCRADVFSLGLILYELVTLTQAVESRDTREILIQIRDGKLRPLHHRYGCPIDRDLRAILRKTLSVNREERYRNAALLAEDLRRYLAGAVPLANPLSWYEKCYREIKHHAMAVATVSLIVLLAAVSIESKQIWSRYQETRSLSLKDRMISKAYNHARKNALQIDRLAYGIQKAMEHTAASVSFLQHANSPLEDMEHICFGTENRNVLTPAPPAGTFTEDPAYKTKVCFERICCHLPEERRTPELLAQLKQISPITEAFRRTFQLRENTGTFHPVRWTYLALENGLYLCYPAVSGFTADYDARKRPWYISGLQSGDNGWGKPYFELMSKDLMIACTTPIRKEDGTVVGIVGTDIALGELAKSIRNTEPESKTIMDQMLVLEDGTILAGHAATPFYEGGTEIDSFPQLASFKPGTLWATIQKSENGYLLQREAGSTILYLIVKLDSFPGYYIEKVAYDKWRKSFL